MVPALGGPPLAYIAGTSRSQTAFRMKKIVLGLPLENSPFLAVSPSSAVLPPFHPRASLSPSRFRTSPHKLRCQLCNPGGWEVVLPFRICKTLRSGESTEGLSPRFPLREPARHGRRSHHRDSDGSLGTSSRVRGVLSPDLGLMGTN